MFKIFFLNGRRMQVCRMFLGLYVVVALFASFGAGYAHGACGADAESAKSLLPGTLLGALDVSFGEPSEWSARRVQQHYVFSRLFARILETSLVHKSNNSCRAVLNSKFPGYSVALYAPDNAANAAQSGKCMEWLVHDIFELEVSQDVAAKSKEEVADYIASSSAVSGSSSAGARARSAAAVALLNIYKPGSVLHSLLSVDATAVRSVDVAEFLAWIVDVRARERIGICGLRAGSVLDAIGRPPRFEVAIASPPSSERATDAEIIVQHAGTHQRGLVLVDSDYTESIDGRRVNAARKKLCNNGKLFWLTIQTDNKAQARESIRISCTSPSVVPLYGMANWQVFYIPDDFRYASEDVKRTLGDVARDPDVADLAKRDGAGRVINFPYLVMFEL